MKKSIMSFVLLIALLWALPATAAKEYAIIVADDNMVIASSQLPSLAREGEVLRLLISPYEYDQKRIAVLIGEDGEVQGSFVTADTHEPLGTEDELYESIFPDIREDAYIRAHEYYDELGGLTGDLWYYLEEEIKLPRKERLPIIDFVNWEEDLKMKADDARLTHIKLPDSGRNLFLFYISDPGA